MQKNLFEKFKFVHVSNRFAAAEKRVTGINVSPAFSSKSKAKSSAYDWKCVSWLRFKPNIVTGMEVMTCKVGVFVILKYDVLCFCVLQNVSSTTIWINTVVPSSK